MNKETNKYYLLLHITVLIFGTTGVLGKLIQLDSEVLVWYRLLIALVGIVFFLVITKYSFIVSKKKLGKLAFVGLLIGVHWITFFEAIKLSNVSVALTCFSSSTLFTALLEPIYFKRKIKIYEILLGLVIIFAISLIFSIDLQYKMGIFLSVVSAFLASWFTVLNGKLIEHIPAKRITVYQLFFALIFISMYTFYMVDSIDAFMMTTSDFFYLLILGIVCTSFAFLVSIEVMKKISPYTVSMSVNLEPIYSILIAILIWPESETMSTLFYVAFAIILGAIFANAFFKKRDNKSAVT